MEGSSARIGSLGRIFKNLLAALTARGVSLIQQVIIPPLFIWRYGTAGFGEWSALYGTVGALTMLNFGVQTYMNQDLAVRLQRGEMEGYRTRQSTALRMLIGMVVVALLLLLVVFALPLNNMLRLHLSRASAQWTVYLLSAFVLLAIPGGYLAGIFLGVAKAHRGQNWLSFQMMLSALGLLTGVVLHLSFVALAALLLSTLLLSTAATLADLRRTAPQVTPSLRYWDGSAVKDILRGSGYFALLETSTFLAYSLPLILLQRFVGPVAVAGFVLMRTIFSMCRQALAIPTQSMAAEITHMFGRRDWTALSVLYDRSERVVYLLIAVINATVLLLSPVLIHVWVERKHGVAQGGSELFSPLPYVLASAISMLISLKEHKMQFQVSTNTHEEWASLSVFSYVVMFLVSMGTVRVAGVNGFLWTWLVVEVFQTVRLMDLNSRLFAHVRKADMAYMTRLGVICLVSLLIAFQVLQRTSAWPMWEQALIALGGLLLLVPITWQSFRIRPIFAELMAKMRQRAG